MLLTVLVLPSFFLLVLGWFNTIAFTSTISTTIMITVIITTISISVAVTIALPSIIVLIHIIMINTIVAIIGAVVSNCIMNVTIITANNNASISIPAPVLFVIAAISTGTKQCTITRLLLSSFLCVLVLSSAPLFGLQDIRPSL